MTRLGRFGPEEATLPDAVDNSNEFRIVVERAWHVLNSRAEIAGAHLGAADADTEHASERHEEIATLKNGEATDSSAVLDQQRRS